MAIKNFTAIRNIFERRFPVGRIVNSQPITIGSLEVNLAAGEQTLMPIALIANVLKFNNPENNLP